MDTRYFEDVYPLTPVQRQLLLESHHSAAPARMIYQFTCVIDGNLDVQAYKRAWQKTADLNPGLRMTFQPGPSREALQAINREILVDFEEQDWRSLAKPLRQKNYSRFLETDRNNTFELSRAPLWRLTLVRIGETRYRLIWTFHVLLLDQKSLQLILDEVFARYDSILARREFFPLEASSTKSYVEWVRSQDTAHAEEFWRAELKNCRARSTNISDHLRVPLDDEVFASCERMATVAGISLETLVQAAWALTLGAEVGRQELLIGISVPGRPRSLPSAGGLIGHLANTLPLRVVIEPNKKAIDWLNQLQRKKDQLALFEYCSARQIQRWGAIPGEIQSFPGDTLTIKLPPEGARSSSHTLALRECVLIRKDKVPTTIEIERWSGASERLEALSPREQQLERSLRSLITQPQQTIGRLMNTPAAFAASASTTTAATPQKQSESEQGWVTWIKTEAGINDLFQDLAANAAAKKPFSEIDWSLQDLNQRACQLGRYLSRRGIGPLVPVGLLLESDHNLALSLIGIVKAGGAYIPLDPSADAETVTRILEDLSVPVILTTADLKSRLKRLTEEKTDGSATAYRPHVVCLDSEWEKIAVEKSDAYGIQVSDDHPICILPPANGSRTSTKISNVDMAHALEKTSDWFAFDTGNPWRIAAAGPSKKLIESAQLFTLIQSNSAPMIPEEKPTVPTPVLQSSPSPITAPEPVEAAPTPSARPAISPIQQWFFEQHAAQPHHCNNILVVECTEKLEERPLRTAVRFVQNAHANLRLRFSQADGGWTPRWERELEDVPFEYLDLSGVWAVGQREAIEHRSNVAQNSLNIVEGPLWKFVYFDLGARPDRIFIAFHKLIGGQESLHIFLNDVYKVYHQIKRGDAPFLDVPSVSYEAWIDRLHTRAARGKLSDEAAYWSRMKQGSSLPIDYPFAPNNYDSQETLHVSLTETETRLVLGRVDDKDGLQLNELILSALSMALARWSGENNALIELEVNGRRNDWVDLDVSSTVGWFGVRYPILLHIDQNMPPAEARRQVHSQLEAVPNQGIGYGLLRYFGDKNTRRRLAEISSAQVSFKFLEHTPRLPKGMRPGRDKTGSAYAGENRREVAIAVEARMFEGTLEFEWQYGREQFEKQNISTLVNSFIEELQRP